MLGVIIHWDHKLSFPEAGKRNLFQHYDYVCKAFGVDKLVIVDVDGTMTLNPPHVVVRTLEEAMKEFPEGIKFCAIHPEGVEDHTAYVSPKDVVYVTGPDFSGFDFGNEFDSVYIKTINVKPNLWANQALAIVLASRG